MPSVGTVLTFYHVFKDEVAAATNAKDSNDRDVDDEDFGECDEVFHDPLCEEEVSITVNISSAVKMSDPPYIQGCWRVADRALRAVLPQEDRRG